MMMESEPAKRPTAMKLLKNVLFEKPEEVVPAAAPTT